jgi:hypothetical protein
MSAAFGCLGWVLVALVTIAIARTGADFVSKTLAFEERVKALAGRVDELEKQFRAQVIEGDEPQWARDQEAFVFGQEIVVEIAGEDVSFKATFQGVDVGIDGSAWVVFKVGDAPQKMLPVSRVFVSACEVGK